jgi:hypothetical protein
MSIDVKRASVLLFSLIIVCVIVGPSDSLQSAPALQQRRALKTENILTRIKKAHVRSKVPSKMFHSYRLTGCMFIQPIALPSQANKKEVGCIREETGFANPNSAYVKVIVGTTQVTDLIDLKAGQGWQITTRPATGTPAPARTISELPTAKFEAVAENVRYSLLSLLTVLNRSSELPEGLELTTSRESFVIKWTADSSSNEFFFNKRTLLCEKQVRTTAAGGSVFKYSNYKNASNVMLPFTITMAKADGAILARREIDHWQLGVTWPSNYFDPKNAGAPVQ